MRSPIVEQHLQTRLPPGSPGIPPSLVGRPWPCPARDPDRRATGDRQNQAGRSGRAPPTPGHPDRCPVGAEDLDRSWHWMDKSRRRRWEAARPGRCLPGNVRDNSSSVSRAHAPRCSLSATSQTSRLGACDPTILPGFLTPRYEADLFARPPPTRRHSGQDRLMAEKALDSRQTPFDLPACTGYSSFEVHLTSVVGHCVGNCEPQHGDPGSGSGDHWPL